MKRYLKVVCIQGGPNTKSKEENLNRAIKLLDKASKERPDFVTFSELFNTPYFCVGRYKERFFDWAEPIPGPTTELLGKKAELYGCNIIAPLFEKGIVEGEYYNSAVVIGADGNLIEGALLDGRAVTCYRKNHIPFVPSIDLNEKPYFKPGPGFSVFRTDRADIGILICYDRLFLEGWRALALQGAQIVFLVSAVPGWWGPTGDKFTFPQRSMALQNQLFIVACNKGGREVVNKVETLFFGKSCVVDPFGEIIIQAPENEGPSIISATLDLKAISKARKTLQIYLDRRPDIYYL